MSTLHRIASGFLTLAVLHAQQTSWIQNPTNGHFYALTSQMSWTEAEGEAQLRGGHLATVRNASENAWLASNFATGNECLWIGLNDAQIEGTFVWSSGESTAYFNWNPGEPTNGMGVEDWVHLSLPWVGTQVGAMWNDSPNLANPYGWVARGIVEVTVIQHASYSQFGIGCPGTSGVPVLAPMGNEAPRLGTTSRLRASQLSPSIHVVIMVIGLSTTQNNGPLGTYPLPFDLTPFGMPGCQQLVADNFTDFRLCLNGQVDWPLTVPSDPGLVGAILHIQALSYESPTVAAVSNAVTATVGY